MSHKSFYSFQPLSVFGKATRLAFWMGAMGLGANQALAGEVLVTPLVSTNLKSEEVTNLAGLVAWELEFAGDFEFVNQLDSKPSSLNSRCLSSATCLAGIARANGASAMVTGAATAKGGQIDLYLVLYRDGKIERAKEFTVKNDDQQIANSMNGIVRELLSGQSPVAEEEQSVIGGDIVADADIFDDEEDDYDDFGSSSRRIPTPGSGEEDLDDFDLMDDGEEERRRAEEEARRRAEEEAARRRAEEEARRRAEEEARRRAEEEARRRAEEEARRRAEEEARRRAEEEAARRRAEEEARILAEEERTRAEREAAYAADYGNDSDLDDFSFGDDEDVEFGGDDDFDFEDSRDTSSSNYSSSRTSQYDDYDSGRRDSYDDYDLDDDLDSSSSSRSSRSRDSRSYSSSSSSQARVERNNSDSSSALAVRAGASKFQDLGFVTYGAEATFKLSESLGLVAGIEAYSTQREIPAALRETGEPEIQWNTILPFNVGAQYFIGSGNVQPYVGADLQFIPGYVKDAGGLAMGLRARGGLTILLADNFGLNANVSAGFWSGSNFESVAKDFSTTAMVPQGSAGAVLFF